MTALIQHPGRHGTAIRVPFGYVQTGSPRLERLQNNISLGCGYIAMACVLAITVITLAEVVARTFFNAPLGWSVSFIEQYLMTGTAFFGTVTAYRSGAHVAVVSLYAQFSQPVRKILILISYLLVMFGIGSVAISGWNSMAFSFGLGEATPPGMAELPLLVWWWKAMIPIAMGIGFIIVLIDFLREVFHPWSATVTDYDPGDAVLEEIESALSSDQGPVDGVSHGGGGTR
jgi:TRAP-type C4-dicarboxylate transport system permease small subunit